ncbi:pyridine nucleotide-disulfide oxidoreductase, partial [Streptomyces sp. NPDC059515]
ATALPADDSQREPGHDALSGVGDDNHRALHTPAGKYQARIAGAAIAARASGGPVDTGPWGAHAATADHATVPQVVFTDPEAASVGLTPAEAEQAGHRVRARHVALGASPPPGQ